MGNDLFLALALSGGGVSPGTLQALTSMRQRNYEKLALFVKWLASTLVYGYYWLKKHPAVLDASNKPDYSEAGTQALVDAFWKQRDQKDFIANLIRDGADLLLSWLKPDDFETKLWGSLMQGSSPAAQTNDLLQSLVDSPAAQEALQRLLGGATGGAGSTRPGAAPPAPPVDRSAPLGSQANPIVRPRGGNL